MTKHFPPQFKSPLWFPDCYGHFIVIVWKMAPTNCTQHAPPPSLNSSPTKITAGSENDDGCGCQIPGEFDSRYCLQQMAEILGSEDLLECEEYGDDVLTIWSIYLRASPSGLLLTDSDLAAHIILNLGLKHQELSYAEGLLDLVRSHLAKGIQITRMGELVDSKRLAYALTIIAQAIVVSPHPLQSQLLEIVTIWLNSARKIKKPSKKPKDEDVSTRPLSSAAFIGSLELSKLPRLLADYVKDGGYSPAYCQLLKFLRHACDVSDTIRRRLLFLSPSLLDPLLLKLCLEDEGNVILRRSVDLIYALFGESFSDLGKDCASCPNEGSFQFLLTRLFLQLQPEASVSKVALNLRNDTAFLVCLLAQRIPSLRTCFGRYSQAIAAIVSTNIFGLTAPLSLSYLLDSTAEDGELLKLFLWMLDLVLSSGSSLHIIEDYQLVPALIAVLMGPSTLINALEASSDISCLQSVAWGVLVSIAKQQPVAFLVSEGVPAMMEYLKIYAKPDSCVDLRLLSMFSHLLRTILSTSDETFAFFRDRDCMSTFVSAISRISQKNWGEREESILVNLLLCSASLGKLGGMRELERFLAANGVHVLIRLLRIALYFPPNERHMNPLFHIGLAECTFACVADSPSCLETFLAFEGPLRILDLLELGASPPASLHILNCLMELCDYPRCMDQVLFWRRRPISRPPRTVFGEGLAREQIETNNGRHLKVVEGLNELAVEQDHTFSALLCNLWRNEEKQWGVLRDKEGCISSTSHPLMSLFARSFSSRRCHHAPSTAPSASTLDLLASVRPKIFLLVKKITESVNTEAQLFEGLSLQNQLTMQIVINFLDLKQAEIWEEIAKELEAEKVTLVPSDIEVLDRLTKIGQNKASAVLATQHFLIQRDREREELREREFYRGIANCHLQDHLRALREADFRARTTNYSYLVERRLAQKCELKKTAAGILKGAVKNGVRVHRTSDGPLNITAWPTPNIYIESEKTNDAASVLESNARSAHSLGESLSLMTIPSSMSLMTIPSSMMLGELHNVSMVTEVDTVATPDSADGTNGGSYAVPPESLAKALQVLLARDKKAGWMANVEDENYWKVRAKWRQEWYPDESVPQSGQLQFY